jgi:hypothetical protein
VGYPQVWEGPEARHRYQMAENNIFLFFIMTALPCGTCSIFYVLQEVVDLFF